MKNWKKNVIAAAVLVVVCAGIYLNWLYTEEQQTANLTDTLNEEKIMSEDMLVMGDDSSLDDVENVNTITDYFAAVRLSRQQARDSAISTIQEAMAYSEGGEAAQSNNQLEQIIQTSLSEAQIESLVIAKGYVDCVAYMSEDGISVAVAAPEEGLQQADVAVIADIVMTQSDYTLNDIHVVEVR